LSGVYVAIPKSGAAEDIGQHAMLGLLQCAGLPRRGEQGHLLNQDTEKRACRGCRQGRQSHAVPQAGRERRRAVARRHALRGDGDRRCGHVVNPAFRDYHLPSFADLPRTEVFFADTADTLGPMGAKSMSESPYNPVAAAFGNALADATGIRFTTVPFKPDRLWPLLRAKFG
jgi:hypothetical protein